MRPRAIIAADVTPMPAPSTLLIHQLARNSTPYHDPLARVRWDQLRNDAWWLPADALSLSGVAEFEALPLASRQRLSQLEFVHVLECGLWLEGVFMERIARSMRRPRARAQLPYRLHELREEAGHSLMFLELMRVSGVTVPPVLPPRHRLVHLFSRYAPMESLAFWTAVFLGEDVPDRLNRYVRANADAVCPAVVDVCTCHVIDEARHIAYARELIAARAADTGPVTRRVLAPLLQSLFRQFVHLFYYPPARVYALAGLADPALWAVRAARNPARAAFLDARLNPTISLLSSYGFALSWR